MDLLHGRRVTFLRAAIAGFACLFLLVGCNGARQSIASPAARAEDEAKIRRLDEDWVKAAESRQVDAWMKFYADDAVVLPPNEKEAQSRESIRKSVGELLGLPGLSLTWQPTKVEVAGSGELAYLYGAYELTMDGPGGTKIKDYGKNVEIWKKQSDGSWKCIVDTWNSDLPPAPVASN
jgi:uncharacterized protein (TIGR02246 family)